MYRYFVHKENLAYKTILRRINGYQQTVQSTLAISSAMDTSPFCHNLARQQMQYTISSAPSCVLPVILEHPRMFLSSATCTLPPVQLVPSIITPKKQTLKTIVLRPACWAELCKSTPAPRKTRLYCRSHHHSSLTSPFRGWEKSQ